MKLILNKDQSKGFFGGVKFELNARVQLTDAEGALVKKYKADNEVLFNKPSQTFLGETITVEPVKINSLTSGLTLKAKNIAEILKYEEAIKEACEAFKAYLHIMENFGGKEEYEY